MFKKLRNRFLLLNLVIITILMFFSFASIYLITFNNIHSDIQRELSMASEIRLKVDKHPDGLSPPYEGYNPAPRPPQQERSVSFTIISDNIGNRVRIISYLDLEDTFYDEAESRALASHGYRGTFKLEGSTWAFIKKAHHQGMSITFLNITSQQAILSNLIYTFLIVAVVMLLFIFLISKFFADRSIKPIKEAFEKQKQFIADSSHELKTPLTVIGANVDVLLANRESTVKEQEKWLQYIKSETERMTRMTNDLLYLARVDDSETKTLFSCVNLSETLSNVILTMEAVIYENNLSLATDSIASGIMVKGNREQLAQVIIILLDNAVKYANPGGSISVSLEKQHHHALLSVANTGEGIPAEHLCRVFDRFYRPDKSRSRKSGGHGLGLSIAKAIVEHHNGKIYAKSIVNEQTTFTVELPLFNC